MEPYKQGTGLHKQNHTTMARFVSMAIVVPGWNSGAGEVLCNGTISFIELPSCGKVLITNWHVWSRFQDGKCESSDVELALICGPQGEGRRPIIVSDSEPICLDQDLDLAILRFARCELIENSGKRFYRAPWPPQIPNSGDTVAFVGYPGDYRGVSERGLEVRSLLIERRVADVSDRNIALEMDDEQAQLILHDPNLPDLDSIGGVSGAALYHQNESKRSAELVGFVHMAGSLIFATRADLLNPDGTTKRA
jgi:hypothetical protein